MYYSDQALFGFRDLVLKNLREFKVQRVTQNRRKTWQSFAEVDYFIVGVNGEQRLHTAVAGEMISLHKIHNILPILNLPVFVF